MILCGVGATPCWAPDAIVANAVNPGGVATGLQKHVPQETPDSWQEAAAAGDGTSKTPQQGAAITLVAAVAPEFATTGGHYLDDGNEVPVIANDADTGLMAQGVRAWAVDPDTARRLWDISLDLTGGVRR